MRNDELRNVLPDNKTYIGSFFATYGFYFSYAIYHSGKSNIIIFAIFLFCVVKYYQ